MSHAEGEGSSFIVRPVAMQPGDQKLVAARFAEIFKGAPAGKPKESMAPSASASGTWQVTVDFIRGSAQHKLELTASGADVRGTHMGTNGQGEVRGSVKGNKVSLRSSIPTEGSRLPYHFNGTIENNRMSGTLSMGEYGEARWSAVRG
jgi:hypothetical protein